MPFMQYTATFTSVKIVNVQMKICDVFLIFVLDIDCGHKQELLLCVGSSKCPKNNTYPCKPSFSIQKLNQWV